MEVIEIKSLEAEEVAAYAGLTEAQLRSRKEPELGVFIAESEKVVRVALTQGLEPLSFLAEQPLVERQVAALYEEYGIAERWGAVPVYTGTREVLSGLTGYALTRGILCAMRRPRLEPLERLCGGLRRVAVMDGVVNSTNTGAIFRAATALGMEALVATERCCDPLNRRSVRVSMGTVLQLGWTWAGDDYAERLRALGFKTVALALNDRALPIDDARLRGEERLAIVMGTEGDGLEDSAIERCDYVARIPMQRGVDSLNVAAAAAVAFWELRVRK